VSKVYIVNMGAAQDGKPVVSALVRAKSKAAALKFVVKNYAKVTRATVEQAVELTRAGVVINDADAPDITPTTTPEPANE
jgi:hypothetical protein